MSLYIVKVIRTRSLIVYGFHFQYLQIRNTAKLKKMKKKLLRKIEKRDLTNK